MPGEAIGLSQILKFFNIRVMVSGVGTEAILNLRQVCERKGNMNLQDTLSASHLLERVERSQLAGGAMRASVWGTQGILWLSVGRRASGRGSRRRSGGTGGRRGRGSS
jgi:hypothetical protein